MAKIVNVRIANLNRVCLVYQAGIANLFQVQSFNPTNRSQSGVTRLYQGDFRTTAMIARGLAMAGVKVRTLACNQAGDIINATWTDDLESQPFSDQFIVINANL